MRLCVTQKWLDKLSKIKSKGFIANNDFIFRYLDQNQNLTIYCCDDGEEMEVNDSHYSNSPCLQKFVEQGYLEIVSL